MRNRLFEKVDSTAGNRQAAVIPYVIMYAYIKVYRSVLRKEKVTKETRAEMPTDCGFLFEIQIMFITFAVFIMSAETYNNHTV